MNLELAKYDFKIPDTLDDFEISAILPRIDELIKWGKDIKNYALSKASFGTHFDGFRFGLIEHDQVAISYPYSS